MPPHGRNSICLAVPRTITRQAPTRAQDLEHLVARVTCPDEENYLLNDSSLTAWPMHDMDMIQTALVKVNSQSHYVLF
ncbi:hypothetical protein PABG_11158 [Paracoccidioides brasiliensis Pb03]|nr:hypothetical protein PABG_11158 [Paracoccidioides brasiliensis Pb03]